MASISKSADGSRMIQFAGRDGKRRSVRLGKMPLRMAESIKRRVECLVAAQLSQHAVDDETSRWVARLDERLADKLARVGLIPQRDSSTLKPFLDGYKLGRADVKSGTKIFYQQTIDKLVEFFGANRQLRDVTAGDADQFRLRLVADGLAENTVRRRCKLAKQFFRFAVRKGLIPSNPFEDHGGGPVTNAARFYFVTRAEAAKVIDACPDAEWRLLFALSRFGGLRCPSEHLSLKWGDVDWERGRINVRSPKTERHEGKASRIVPLFPELLKHLQDVFDEAEPGTEYVISRYRQTNVNLRTQLERIIVRAGLKPWPKLFQNLRSTRETELAEEYPMHVVCAWIGNSEAIAAKHYLQLTDEHFQRALKPSPGALQKALQHLPEQGRTQEMPSGDAGEISRECTPVQDDSVCKVGPV